MFPSYNYKKLHDAETLNMSQMSMPNVTSDNTSPNEGAIIHIDPSNQDGSGSQTNFHDGDDTNDYGSVIRSDIMKGEQQILVNK